MDRIVHVCNGDSTADTLSLADLPGEIRVWADALDEGPLVPGSDEAHYAARAAWWGARGETDRARDAGTSLREYDRGLDEAATADELILWFEHDLFDQLALVRILARLARRGMPATLSIVSIDRHPEVPAFLGLGQLGPEQLAALWPRRTGLSKDAIDEAIATWIAVTAADPRALPYLMRRIKAMPFLAGAIERHLEEYPDPASGLSRTERQLLAAVARGASRGDELMTAVHAIDPRYPITDALLLRTLQTLQSIGFVEGAPAGAPGPATLAAPGIAITALGRQALAGALDRVATAGLDTWRGGVYLSGRGPLWRWDSAARKLVEQ